MTRFGADSPEAYPASGPALGTARQGQWRARRPGASGAAKSQGTQGRPQDWTRLGRRSAVARRTKVYGRNRRPRATGASINFGRLKTTRPTIELVGQDLLNEAPQAPVHPASPHYRNRLAENLRNYTKSFPDCKSERSDSNTPPKPQQSRGRPDRNLQNPAQSPLAQGGSLFLPRRGRGIPSVSLATFGRAGLSGRHVFSTQPTGKIVVERRGEHESPRASAIYRSPNEEN